MITQDDISRAVCDHDALLEETGDIDGLVERLGVDIGGALHVSEQRALRCAMKRDELPNVGWGGPPREVRLTPETRALMPTFIALWMDAFCAGVQCEKTKT